METYDPMNAPDPGEWQSLDEGEQIDLVMDYHSEANVKLPNEQIHAVIHVVVENQVAMGDELPVRATLDRLMREGLDRHDAIHAIGAVVFAHLQAILDAGVAGPNDNERLFKELEKLNAAEWVKGFG